MAKEKNLLLEFDQENRCEILNDEALRHYLDENFFQKSPFSSPSGLILDFHSAGIIPDNNQIHQIFVLRTSADVLKQRLEKRNLPSEILESKINFEKFAVCLNEARESFYESIVLELQNDTEEDFKKNVEFVSDWIEKWPINTFVD